MIAQNVTQCRMQQVGSRVMQGGCVTAVIINNRLYGITLPDLALLHKAFMGNCLSNFLGIGNRKQSITDPQQARIAHLTTRFRIERGMIQNDQPLITGFQCRNGFVSQIDGGYN